MTTLAVVLAAGAGRRFGGGKLHALFRGRPLLAWALEAAAGAGLDATVVVTGGEAVDDLVPAVVTAVANPRWAEGQATSLQVAVAVAEPGSHDTLVVGLADTPFVPTAAWTAVAAADGPIAVAEYDGLRRPPVRLDRSVWALLPTEGDEGARALLRERPDLVTAVPCAGDPADVDTRGDLARWS